MAHQLKVLAALPGSLALFPAPTWLLIAPVLGIHKGKKPIHVKVNIISNI